MRARGQSQSTGIPRVVACAVLAAIMGSGGCSGITGAAGNEQTAEISYLTGLQNPEDILQIGESKWLLASGLKSWTDPENGSGHIYLVDSEQDTFEVLFPGPDPAFRPDRETFADCPGPIDTGNFSAHGLALKEAGPARYRLYMTSHGAREAIEVFDVDMAGARPALAWVGCVILPERMWGNSVAILGDGGFLATKSKDSGNPNAFADLVARKITGEVHEWHPGRAVERVAGTELSCPNGIAVSPDDRWAFVTAMGTHEVVRFDRHATPIASVAASVPVYPDNIHWGDDGQLYLVGRNVVPQPDGKSCPLLNCGTGWSIVRVDPQTLAVERVAGVDEKADLSAPSAVITAGSRFWIGNFDGDRVGYIRRPDEPERRR